MRIEILTIFPEMFGPFLDTGIVRIAQEKGLLAVSLRELREYAPDKRRSIEDRPVGVEDHQLLEYVWDNPHDLECRKRLRTIARDR